MTPITTKFEHDLSMEAVVPSEIDVWVRDTNGVPLYIHEVRFNARAINQNQPVPMSAFETEELVKGLLEAGADPTKLSQYMDQAKVMAEQAVKNMQNFKEEERDVE